MKTYSIGRDVNCNIVINDNSDVISRRHAILNVTSSGKMTIIDQSRNGTYVNGIRIAENVPVPVTRKDNVSFAHIAKLDWDMVPKSYSPLTYAVVLLVAALVGVGIFLAVKSFSGGSEDKTEPAVKTPSAEEQVVLTPDQVKHREDSLRDVILKQVKDEAEQLRKKDSIDAETAKKVEQARQDSIAKVRKDSVRRANKKQQKKQDKPAVEPKKEEEAPSFI